MRLSPLLLALSSLIGCFGQALPSEVPEGYGPMPLTTARLSSFLPEQAAERPISTECTFVRPPAEQHTDLGQCRRHHSPRPTDRFAAGWFQVVADTPHSTVEILSATLYGIREDGSHVALAGTGVGQAPVVWAGAYLRTPWFGNDASGNDAFTPLPVTASSTYRATIPTGRTLLHGGPAHADITGYVDTVFIVQVHTTGDARVQIGVDYRPQSPSDDVNEVALSDWFQSDGACVRATPRLSAKMNCRSPVD